MYSRELFRDILEWDIQSWKQAVLFWDRFTADIAGARVLDIGARNGGLSLYFALKGAHVICSDLKGQPFQGADSCHFRLAMSLAVETWPPFLYFDFFGGGFLGPRGCFW